MRYAAMNQDTDPLAHYRDYRPADSIPFGTPPDDPAKLTDGRYSDEQLYALALYSLQPPPTPNKFDEIAAKGKQVFEHEGCAGCHTPPLYTNNKLTPALGFTPPASHVTVYV